MKIKLIAVGKIKDKNLQALINEYIKRLSSYCSSEIIEVKDEAVDTTSLKEIEKYKVLEGKNILKNIKDKEYVITLDLNKNSPNSVQFADILRNKFVEGGASLTFVIGGSYGLSEEVRKRSNYGFSLSNLTFLHTMTRLILLEQIYRAFKIISNETYHK